MNNKYSPTNTPGTKASEINITFTNPVFALLGEPITEKELLMWEYIKELKSLLSKTDKENQELKETLKGMGIRV